MGRRYIYRCDGCDAETATASETLPGSWADARIAVDGLTNWLSGGSAHQIHHRLLCPQCQITLAERVDPKAWGRIAHA